MDARRAWHYTLGQQATDILRDGLIRPAAVRAPNPFGAAVWFSLRQQWEPSAGQGNLADAARPKINLGEVIEQRGGLWRFGVSAGELLAWRQAQSALGMSREAARALERGAREVGADPALWFASLEPVRIDRCVVEHLHGHHWCGAEHDHDHAEHDHDHDHEHTGHDHH